MHSSIRCLTVFSILSCFPTDVRADTWFVDDDGGPNADYVTIQAAIDASLPGDVIVVERGIYAGFTLDRGVSIVGSQSEPGAMVTESAYVDGIPAAAKAVLSGLHLEQLFVRSSAGVVVLDNLDFDAADPDYCGFCDVAAVEVTDCADVRMFECLANGLDWGESWDQTNGLMLESSRMEVVSSYLRGVDGQDTFDCLDAGHAGAGVTAAGSEISLFLTDARGGEGGFGTYDFCEWTSGCGGYGGHGLYADGSSVVMLAGLPSHLFMGGPGGIGTDFGAPCDGIDGYGVRTWSSHVRHSGVSLDSTSFFSSTTENPDPADPSLDLLGVHAAGEWITFRLHGPPGAEGILYLGRLAELTPIPGRFVDQLTSRQRSYPVGTFPANGILDFSFPMPAWMYRGFSFFAQGEAILPGGEGRLTNSVPVVVRELPLP